MFRKREREGKEVNMDPGLEKMMELAKRQRMQARMPHVEVVVEALNEFFKAKHDQKKPVEDNQAHLALQSLEYCFSAGSDAATATEGQRTLFQPSELQIALSTLSLDQKLITNTHAALASLLFNALRPSEDLYAVRAGLVHYITVLAATGSTMQARELLLQEEDRLYSFSGHRPRSYKQIDNGVEKTVASWAVWKAGSSSAAEAWAPLIAGFARENNGDEIRSTRKMYYARGLKKLGQEGVMLDFFLARNDMAEAYLWWKKLSSEDVAVPENVAVPLNSMLKWCLENGEIRKGDEIIGDVTKTSPPKPVWDVIFGWAAATGKGADEIDRMIGVMEKSNETLATDQSPRLADVTTINSLVAYAVSKDDPYLAERFIAIGRERGIEPNARTYTLQMDYRLRVNDLDGAIVAYKKLQSMDLSSNDDAPTVNRLVAALCTSPRHDFDTVMSVAGDMTDRNLRFESATVTALCVLHLTRNEVHDATDLLNTYAYHYSSTDRNNISDAILAFALNDKTSITRAWAAYNILRNIFDETPRTQRTSLMTSFFRRRRADMGVQVFQHMRQHTRADTIPTVDTYVTAFMELAKLRNLDSLEVVHNQLKLDFNVDTTTYMRNALIIAYTHCGEPRKALEFWNDTISSREGPSYNSIHAALRACEKSPFGDVESQRIWDLLRRRKIELDQSLWASYVAALAGNGDNEIAIKALEQGVEDGEVEVDAFIVGSLFEGASGQIKQKEIEEWAKARHPDCWAELEKVGVQVDENFMRKFNIDRRIGP